MVLQINTHTLEYYTTNDLWAAKLNELFTRQLNWVHIFVVNTLMENCDLFYLLNMNSLQFAYALIVLPISFNNTQIEMKENLFSTIWLMFANKLDILLKSRTSFSSLLLDINIFMFFLELLLFISVFTELIVAQTRLFVKYLTKLYSKNDRIVKLLSIKCWNGSKYSVCAVKCISITIWKVVLSILDIVTNWNFGTVFFMCIVSFRECTVNHWNCFVWLLKSTQLSQSHTTDFQSIAEQTMAKCQQMLSRSANFFFRCYSKWIQMNSFPLAICKMKRLNTIYWRQSVFWFFKFRMLMKLDWYVTCR